MNQEKTRHIICAVRGGPESRETVTYAIHTALETQAHLTFFHVMNAEFVQHATIGPLSVVYSELVEMGKFAMLILCDRARRRGVSEVDFLIQEGNVKNKLRTLVSETKADLLVLGSPTRSPGSNEFKPNELDALIAELSVQSSIRIIKVPARVDNPDSQ
jgi:nucleotide-binding universal stress UspA family protein